MGTAARVIAALALAAPVTAAADTWHGSLGAGGSAVITGAAGHHLRLDLGAELFPGWPWHRWGVVGAVRAYGRDAGDGLASLGVSYLAAAARPRLALALYGDLGVTLTQPAPAVGGGVRATLKLVGPLALVGDVGGHLVVDGVDGTRFVLGVGALLAVAR